MQYEKRREMISLVSGLRGNDFSFTINYTIVSGFFIDVCYQLIIFFSLLC